MKTAWNFFRGALEIVTQTLLYWPLVLAALANLVCHFSPWAVILLAASLLSALLVHFAIIFRYDANINRELFSTLSEYPNYSFTKLDMKELVNRYASYDAIQGTLYQNNQREIGAAYVAVLEDRTVKKRYLNPKAFPRAFSFNVVLVPKNIENGDILRQFLFFHELGHLTTIQRKLYLLGPRSAIGAACALFIGACLFPWYLTLALLAFVRIWHGSCVGIALIADADSGAEQLADGFALTVLRRHPAFLTLERLLADSSDRRLQFAKKSVEFFKNRFESFETNMPPNFWRKNRKPEKNSRWSFFYQHALSSDAVIYNSVESQYFPYHFWPAYCLCALLIVGVALREPTSAQYVLLSAVPTLAAGLAARKYFLACFYAKVMADAKLEGAEVVAPTEKLQKRMEKAVAPRNGFWRRAKQKAAVILADDEARKPLT